MSGAGTPVAAAAGGAAGGGAAATPPGCRAARELVVLNVGELPDAGAAADSPHERQQLSLHFHPLPSTRASAPVLCVAFPHLQPSLPHTAVFTPLTPRRWHALHHHPHHADHAR